MSKGKVPVPVITETLLAKINEEVNALENVPDCPVLKAYFKQRIFGTTDQIHFSETDFDSIASMFSEFIGTNPNINKVLEYYIVQFPAYQSLRDKCQELQTNADIHFNQWYKEFFCYLKVKLEAVPDMMAVKVTKDASTMTSPQKPTDYNISEFCLDIMGPTNIINNLVFSSVKDDVLVRYHKNKLMHTFRKSTYINALMNYPNIKIELNVRTFSLPLISISRSCECLYDRFIVNEYKLSQKKMFQSHSTKKAQSRLDSRIRSIELVEAKESLSYTHGFINEYMKIFLELVNKCSERVSYMRKEELKLFLVEFLTDIVEMNLYNNSVVATNTAVNFLIGSTKYERYRFIKKTDVNFIEILSPVVTLYLKEFNPLHAVDNQENLYFKQLKLFEQNLTAFEDIILKEDTIKYICTLCSTSYDFIGIVNHILVDHEPEVGVVCEKCQLSLDVVTLSSRRWKHICFE